MKKWVSIKEAAAATSRTTRTIQAWINEGRVQVRRLSPRAVYVLLGEDGLPVPPLEKTDG